MVGRSFNERECTRIYVCVQLQKHHTLARARTYARTHTRTHTSAHVRHSPELLDETWGHTVVFRTNQYMAILWKRVPT